MEVDWEIEVGGGTPGCGAPVIDALWPGFVDLRQNPARIGEIAETAAFPPLAGLLLVLNGPASPLWTSKCDLWEPEAAELAGPGSRESASSVLACYVDLLPLAGQVFAQWQQAEAFCREWVARLASDRLPECRVELIVRQAIAGQAEGFGVTAYLSATGQARSAAAASLAAALDAFAAAIPSAAAPGKAASKLQLKSTGE
ncbi:MAG: hypothetical protein ABSE99_08155 [Terracidiphilus sp.]|jgi:hypothetical protein